MHCHIQTNHFPFYINIRVISELNTTYQVNLISSRNSRDNQYILTHRYCPQQAKSQSFCTNLIFSGKKKRESMSQSYSHISVQIDFLQKEITLRRGSGMYVPDGLPGFTTVTSFGTGLCSDRVFSNQSIKQPRNILEC